MTIPVLICDDSALARKQMARAIPTSLNAEVTFAVHGLDALEKLNEQDFKLMFLDLTMPELDGYGTLEAIRDQGIDINVIVVSGDIQPKAQERVLGLGAKAFLKKPVDKTLLLETLKSLSLNKSDDDDFTTIQRIVTPKLRRRDIYLEVANVAIGRAADSLARHFDVFVHLPLPNVNLFELSELHMTLK